MDMVTLHVTLALTLTRQCRRRYWRVLFVDVRHVTWFAYLVQNQFGVWMVPMDSALYEVRGGQRGPRRLVNGDFLRREGLQEVAWRPLPKALRA